MVEIDVQPTSDGRLVVFHDAGLDCRTDGHGTTREQPLAALQALDVGHGYTADGGQTWPFRGEGVGLIPVLEEVFDAFPDAPFVLDLKTGETDLIVAFLDGLTASRRALLWVYGAPAPVEVVAARFPEVRTFIWGQSIGCLKGYLRTGWR
ncbi:MAG: glycerophosphoryl diester phosphodiesterase, partial [Myxococcota bacterium]